MHISTLTVRDLVQALDTINDHDTVNDITIEISNKFIKFVSKQHKYTVQYTIREDGRVLYGDRQRPTQFQSRQSRGRTSESGAPTSTRGAPHNRSVQNEDQNQVGRDECGRGGRGAGTGRRDGDNTVFQQFINNYTTHSPNTSPINSHKKTRSAKVDQSNNGIRTNHLDNVVWTDSTVNGHMVKIGKADGNIVQIAGPRLTLGFTHSQIRSNHVKLAIYNQLDTTRITLKDKSTQSKLIYKASLTPEAYNINVHRTGQLHIEASQQADDGMIAGTSTDEVKAAHNDEVMNQLQEEAEDDIIEMIENLPKPVQEECLICHATTDLQEIDAIAIHHFIQPLTVEQFDNHYHYCTSCIREEPALMHYLIGIKHAMTRTRYTFDNADTLIAKEIAHEDQARDNLALAKTLENEKLEAEVEKLSSEAKKERSLDDKIKAETVKLEHESRKLDTENIETLEKVYTQREITVKTKAETEKIIVDKTKLSAEVDKIKAETKKITSETTHDDIVEADRITKLLELTIKKLNLEKECNTMTAKFNLTDAYGFLGCRVNGMQINNKFEQYATQILNSYFDKLSNITNYERLYSIKILLTMYANDTNFAQASMLDFNPKKMDMAELEHVPFSKRRMYKTVERINKANKTKTLQVDKDTKWNKFKSYFGAKIPVVEVQSF